MPKAIFPPESQAPLRRKYPHRIVLKTSVGQIEVWSVYGQDVETKQWLCPLRERWELGARQSRSPVLEERLCFTAALTGSYESAARVARKWGTEADDSTIHAHVREAGAWAESLREERIERALDPATRADVVAEASENLPDSPFSLVIMMDGWMIRERGVQWGAKPPEKQADRVEWREMKSGIIFRLQDRGASDSGRRFIVEKYYEAHRGDPYDFGRCLYAEALRRGLNQAEHVYVVADGAPWIWNLQEDRFSEATGVLDFYHASEHLWAIARELHGEEEGKARRWVEPLLHQLKHGGESKVLRRLKDTLKRKARAGERSAEILRTGTAYFHTHRAHLHYESVGSEGCPQGSGAMESTCAQFQDRFKRTGQFWTPSGEKHLLLLELARRNGDWDEIWKVAA
jgi:hypothetical protein